MSLGATLIIIALVLLSAFFAGAEVALVSLSRAKVRTLVAQKRPGAHALTTLKQQPHRMIIAILVGNNIVNVSASALTTMVAIAAFGSQAVGIAAGLLTLFLLIVGEIIPKTFAQNNADRYALVAAGPILLLTRLLFPVIVVLDWTSSITQRALGTGDANPLSEAEIRAMIQIGVEHKVLEPEEQQIINRAIRFSDTVVAQIMTPAQDIFSLSEHISVNDAVAQLVQQGFSRAPVFSTDDSTHAIGVALMPMLSGAVQAGSSHVPLRNVLDEPLYLSDELGIDDALAKMQKTHTHLAIVRNRKRKIVGLVTLEDIVEELLGEIDDEKVRHRKRP